MSVNVSTVAAAFVAAALVAGCGTEHDRRRQSHAPAAKVATSKPVNTRAVRDYRRLWADVRKLRAEALTVKESSLMGTPTLRRSTGRFIEDLDRSVLSLKARNRMIDHAAAAVAPACEQCFQQLEAIRPIPQIAGH